MPAVVTVNVTITVKTFALVPVPPGVVTLSGPVVAPVGTVAWIVVAEVTVKLALTPLNATAVAPVKFVPLIVTLVPTGPLVGVKPVIVGALATMTVTVVESEFGASATVTVCGPAVANSIEKVPWPLVNVESAGSTTPGAVSLLLKWTVPVYPATRFP